MGQSTVNSLQSTAPPGLSAVIIGGSCYTQRKALSDSDRLVADVKNSGRSNSCNLEGRRPTLRKVPAANVKGETRTRKPSPRRQ